MKILGLDPALRTTGWGIIHINGNNISYVGDGIIKVSDKLPMAERLKHIYAQVQEIALKYQPDYCGLEEIYLNKNPQSTLKLCQARGVAMVALANSGLDVAEYSATKVKQSICGSGSAKKDQVIAMVKLLLPQAQLPTHDAADALAIAICTAHHIQTQQNLKGY